VTTSYFMRGAKVFDCDEPMNVCKESISISTNK
jgi:hypothetical protein